MLWEAVHSFCGARQEGSSVAILDLQSTPTTPGAGVNGMRAVQAERLKGHERENFGFEASRCRSIV